MVSRTVILAVVIAAILVVSGAYYFTNVLGGSSGNSVTVNIEVTPGLYGQNATQHPDTYSPRNFTVTEGQRVTIVLYNSDDGPHGLAIPQFGVNSGVVQGGQTVRLTFSPNQVGVFEYFEPAGICNAGGVAPQQGGCTGAQLMTGNMTVSAP